MLVEACDVSSRMVLGPPPALFDILDDFTHLLDRGLHVDDPVRNLDVIGFRTNGIDLAKQFLTEEFQLPAARTFGIQQRAVLLDV
jgi:hypothetical protein